jgi:lipopolysaccharide/colanic/teichoic acid biosynthesis glycosyltransferase
MSTATFDDSTATVLPALPLQRVPNLVVLPGSRQLAKHVVDRVLAALLLVVLAPVFLIASAAVLCSGRGGVLYRQERVGRHGHRFTILKFRTMRPEGHTLREQLRWRDNGNGMLFKLHDDPRVTAVGRVLRRWSLDELPQLFNVLRGEMSLVGPRPALPEEVARYSHHERRRLLVKPGLTGLWQVSGRSDLSWAESVALDLHYVERTSLALDARILLRTVGAVASGRGAY